MVHAASISFVIHSSDWCHLDPFFYSNNDSGGTLQFRNTEPGFWDGIGTGAGTDTGQDTRYKISCILYILYLVSCKDKDKDKDFYQHRIRYRQSPLDLVDGELRSEG